MPANVETMAFVGETPWHGLGVKLPAAPTVAQMRTAAGLTWEPSLRDLTYAFGAETRTVPSKVLVRDDTGAELDIVGPNYVPIKNAEVLEFFHEYAAAGDLALETAGVLDDGRWVWALAKMGAGFTVHGKDRVEGYVLLANPHIYGKGAVGKLTMVRVVCMNTLQAALAGGSDAVKIWHTAEFNAARRSTVQEQMGIARTTLDAYKAEAEALTNLALKTPKARAILGEIFEVTVPENWEKAPAKLRAVDALFAGAGRGAALPGAAGTGWGLLNAVTEYVDHQAGHTANTRLRGAWFGSGAGVKEKARKVLVHAATAKKGR